jgi:hypothetical protein
MEFRIVSGAPFGPEDASIIGPRLAALAAEGLLRPEVVVEDARPAGSLLHGYFEWEDSIAALRYRREQARKMIQSIEVIPAEAKEPVRYFHYVREETPSADGKATPSIGRGFATLDMVQHNPMFMTQVVEAARRELVGWRRRYGQYKELAHEASMVQQALAVAEVV